MAITRLSRRSSWTVDSTRITEDSDRNSTGRHTLKGKQQRSCRQLTPHESLGDQNHIETEKLIPSLFIACHHPGGKNSKSPGSKVTDSAQGTARSQNRGYSDLLSEASSGDDTRTSTREVLLNDGLSLFAAGFRGCGELLESASSTAALAI